MVKKIITPRTVLRNFHIEDLEDLYTYCSQEGVGDAAGWAKHNTLEQSAELLHKFIQNENQFAIVYKENNKVIGHIGIHEDSENYRTDTKELGYVLNKTYWNYGIMTEVMTVILEVLFSQGIEFVYACCFQDNAASKHLIEKIGFTFEKEGTFYSNSLLKSFETYEYLYTKEHWKSCKS
jgi:ribosomal-protein-alanine N-acetyltransferase